MNYKQRTVIDPEYLSFIHRLPCCVTGKCGVHAHHVAVKGMSSVVNDRYAIPVSSDIHFDGISHVTIERLQRKIMEPIYELIIFYNALYSDYITGKYNLDGDETVSFVELRKRISGGNGK
jgi:hypothetical protein